MIVRTESGQSFPTNYRTLSTPPSNDNLINSILGSNRNQDVDFAQFFRQRQDNIRNIYIEFDKPTFVYEIMLASPFKLLCLKSEKSELTVKNLDNNESFNINSTEIYPNIRLSTFNFQIKPQTTDRIFVYSQSQKNKLVHVTDYIPKGTTQNVTINYLQGVKSSVIPVYPLPVPNFNRYVSNVKAPYYGGDDDQGWNGGAICRGGQILESKGVQIGNNDSYMDGSCMSIYDNNKIPVSSINNDGYQNITYYTDYNPNRFYNCEDGNDRGKIADIQFFGYEDCHGACVAGSRRWTTYRNTGIKIEQCAYPSILIPPAVTWSKTPKNLIEGGQEGSTKTYVCRALDGDKWVPGKFHSNNCYYGNNGGKVTNTSYELASANESLVWRNKTDVPTEKKIEGGINGDNTVTYICRVNHLGMWIPGKEVGNSICYFEYWGENASNTYQLLSRQ